MKTAPHLKIEFTDSVTDGDRTADGTRGPVERCKKAITSRINLTPPESGDFVPNQRRVSVEQASPGNVSQVSCALGRANNVAKKNRGERPIRVAVRRHPSEKLQDRVEGGIRFS
jgi:hypothetical protein